MPIARKCSFCGGRLKLGSGVMSVKRDGTVLFICSSKCEQNIRLGRKPHRVKWTERSRRIRGKA